MIRAALVSLICAAALPLAARDLFIAPNGNDAYPGTAEKPFATLEGARDAARSVKSEAVTVWIRGGVYLREKSFAQGYCVLCRAPGVSRDREMA